MQRHHRDSLGRPACMEALGLLPPYSTEDVKKAYREKAKSAHPDAGGDPEAFKALHDAYEHALGVASFNESRRHWMGDRVERYADRLSLIQEIEQRGGRCELQDVDSYAVQYGSDFAQMLSELQTVHLNGPSIGDADLEIFRSSAPTVREIRMLYLTATNITDGGLECLDALELRGLDVSETQVSFEGLQIINRLPKLKWIHVGQTKLGMLKRMKLQREFPDLTVVTDPTATPPEFGAFGYQQMQILQRLQNL